MGDIAINIWEKSIFLGSIGSQKGAKNATFLQGGQNLPPAICRVNWGMEQGGLLAST